MRRRRRLATARRARRRCPGRSSTRSRPRARGRASRHLPSPIGVRTAERAVTVVGEHVGRREAGIASCRGTRTRRSPSTRRRRASTRTPVGDRVGGRAPAVRCVPSSRFQPKLSPLPALRRSSRRRGRSPPTRSARRHRSRGRRWRGRSENRHGLRRPYAQISGRRAAVSTNGLSGRHRVRRAAASGVGSIRRILPSSVSSDWPLPPARGPGPRRPARRRRRGRCRGRRRARTRAGRRCGSAAAGRR